MNFYSDIDKYAQRIAIITEQGEQMTYRQLIAEGDRLFERVQERSILFLVCRNCPEAICAYIGALRKLVVPLVIDTGIDTDLFQQLCQAYRPSYIYAPRGWEPIRAAELQEIEVCQGFVLCQTSWEQDYELHPELALLPAASDGIRRVRQSYANLNAGASSIAECLNIQGDDKVVIAMPMSSFEGISMISSYLLQGAAIILRDASVEGQQFWSVVRQQKPAVLGGMAYMDGPVEDRRAVLQKLSGLRTMVQIGNGQAAGMAEKWNLLCEEAGIEMVCIYGKAEAVAGMAYLPWNQTGKKTGCIGIPMPGGVLSVIDVYGNEVQQPGAVGELIYLGSGVTMGNVEDCYGLDKEDENGGILYTGDLAFRDEDGFYYIVLEEQPEG